MTAKQGAQAAATLFDLEEPLYRARNATKALEMIVDVILESRHPLPTQPDSVELILGIDDLEAALYAMADARNRTGEAYEAWKVLVQQEQVAVSPPLARNVSSLD